MKTRCLGILAIRFQIRAAAAEPFDIGLIIYNRRPYKANGSYNSTYSHVVSRRCPEVETSKADGDEIRLNASEDLLACCFERKRGEGGEGEKGGGGEEEGEGEG